MICNKCFQYIKLKWFFFISTFSSNNICKKENMATILKNRTINTPIKNWSMINDGDDYGQFYDTENNKNIIQESKIIQDYYDDPYEEYLDRYEHHLNYEEGQIANEYIGKSIYEKLINGELLFYEHPLLYMVQYILSYYY